MRQDSFRFSPPLLELSPSIREALCLGFGDPSPDLIFSAEPKEIYDWSFRLGLVERSAQRVGREVLETRLGGPIAERFLADSHSATARLMLLREVAEILADLAEELGLPVIFLKGFALVESGLTAFGSRPLADLDVLVPESGAQQLATSLCSQGFRSTDIRDTEFHLPPLVHSKLGTVEIHVYLRGVKIDRRPATAESLLAGGLCRVAPDLTPGWLPRRPVLAAHTVTHGVDQHGLSPSSYPLLRMVSDLLDLAGSPDGIEALLSQAAPFLGTSVSERELSAVTELCRTLAASGGPPIESDAGRLLGHVLAAHLEPDYLAALKVSAFKSAVSRGDWHKIRRRVGRSVFGTQGRSLGHALTSLLGVGWSWLRRSFKRRPS